MTAGRRLYERAIPTGPGPLWHVDAGRTFFCGPLTYNAGHQHGAPVYLAGVYGPFQLRFAGGDWLSCRTALIPAGVLHELNVHGEPIGVLYLEPSIDGADALAPLLRDVRETNGCLVGDSGEHALVRALWEDAASVAWTGPALDDLLAHAQRRARRRIDPRIARVLAVMARPGDAPETMPRLAGVAGLSASRFQHMFTAAVGVPFRRYRSWLRMRQAIAAVAEGSNFTSAAHAAGFADQAHFSHDFRRTFGAAPSRSLLRVRR